MHTLGLSKFSKRARQKNTEAQPELSLAAEDEMLKNIGARNMLFGGFFFLAGLILTIITFAAASSSGGGRFILAWGAIFWGGAQFFRGLIQTSRANR